MSGDTGAPLGVLVTVTVSVTGADGATEPVVFVPSLHAVSPTASRAMTSERRM